MFLPYIIWLSQYNTSIYSTFFLIHKQKDLLQAVEKLATRSFIPFTPGQAKHNSLHQSPIFFCPLPSMLCSSLWLLLTHFGTIFLSPDIIIQNHSSTTSFYLLHLSYTPLPPSWAISQFQLVTKSSAYKPLMIIFQNSPKGGQQLNDPSQLIKTPQVSEQRTPLRAKVVV